jgi:LPXTG-motif cell wall-anchored protein
VPVSVAGAVPAPSDVTADQPPATTGPAGTPVSAQAAAATPATLPATGGGAPLLLGAALLGAAGITHVVRRRAEVDGTS